MTESESNLSKAIEESWQSNRRWKGISRQYKAAAVARLRPTLKIQYSLAEHGAQRLWLALHSEPYLQSLGAVSGAQAVQMARAGLKSIYCSGWQVAADANLSGETYLDQSLYPSNSVPNLVRRINNALTRADLVEKGEKAEKNESDRNFDWYLPIVADAEAGFGGPVHAFELMKAMIAAGAAAVHFEDQLAGDEFVGVDYEFGVGA